MISKLSTWMGLAPRTLTGALLVAGTSIGGGMLALPVTGAAAGFIPGICFMSVAWVMMTVTALCLVEIGFWMKKSDAHIITMASTILGPWGKRLVWFLFLFISYASLTAYTAGCGSLFAKEITAMSGYEVSKTTGSILFTLLFGPFFLGPRHVLGKVNDLLFVMMVVTFAFIIGKGFDLIQVPYLLRHNWEVSYLGIPLLITAFSFQTMVPSLHPFLDHDKKSLRVAVVLGTVITFCIYTLWQLVIFGGIGLEGEAGLAAAFAKGEPATYCLAQLTHSPIIPYAASFFALFALVTSYFGMGIGLFDFLGDGLNINRRGRGALLLGFLVLVPSLIFAIGFERIFIVALDVSGGFGDTILNGVIPLLMIWIGMKQFAPLAAQRLGYKRAVMVLFLALFALAFAAEVTSRLSPDYIPVEESSIVE